MNYRKNNNILIEKYKCLFFILPKNACSSMKALLVDQLGLKKGSDYPTDIHDPRVYAYPFARIEELNNQFDEYLKFCIVRNPWDRLVSCYKDKIRAVDYIANGYKNGVAIPLLKNSDRFYGGMSFEEFVDVVCSIPDSKSEHHFTSQLYQLTNPEGQLLVNYIGRLETLHEDLVAISTQTGLPLENFPHLRKTTSKRYWEFYNEELIEKVRIRYAADVSIFDYTYGKEGNPKRIGFVQDWFKKRLYSSEEIQWIIREKKNTRA